MLRVEFYDKSDFVMMRVQGRFVGRFAEDVRDLVARRQVRSRLILDLSEANFVDEIGEDILSWLAKIGTSFIADTAYSADICERLKLPQISMVNGKICGRKSTASAVNA
jgi:hypothetical protein